MNKIAIIFGTDTGNTRRIAKQIYKYLGPEKAEKPINIGKLTIEQFCGYDKMILGTPTYGLGILPGLETGTLQPSWAEFVEQLSSVNLQDKQIALYGLGDQEKYAENFVDGMYKLYEPLKAAGANIIGRCSADGYSFEQSEAYIDERFIGLVLDQDNQKEMTENRVKQWLSEITKIMYGE